MDKTFYESPKSHNKKTSKVKYVDDIEKSVIAWAGEAPKNPFKWNGKFCNRWGGKKNNKFGFSGYSNKEMGTAWNYTTGEKQTFVTNKIKDSKRVIPLPERPKTNTIKDISVEYNNLPTWEGSHPYLTKKKIKAVTGIKKIEDKLVIPVYGQEGFVISWQTISSKEGPKQKLFKAGCVLGQAYHSIIGQDTDTILVCEGYATGYSIHNINGYRVYCGFSRTNLESLLNHLKKTYPKKKIFLCNDHDGDNTHKTKFKDVITLTPDKRVEKEDGTILKDFNDFQNDQREIFKLKMLAQEPICYPISGLIKPTVHVDENGLVLRAYLGCLSGEKASMKSRGIISYLLNEGNRLLYFSGGENTPAQIQKLLIALNKEPADCLWFDMLNKEWFKRLADYVKRFGSSTILEDPPFSEWATQQETRKALMLRAEIAKTLNISWIFTRNLSKTKYDKMLSNVSGYGLITNIPRFVLGTFPIEIGHQYRETEDDPKISLMQSLVCNEGPTPQNSLLLRLKVANIDAEDGQTASVAYCAPNPLPAVSDPEKWVKSQKGKEEANETRDFKILFHINSNEKGVRQDALVNFISDNFKVSTRWGRDILRALKTKKLVHGGGQGKKAPYKVTEKGKAVLNADLKPKKSLKETLSP